MTAKTLLNIDCHTMQLSAKFITQLLSTSSITCGLCSKPLQLSIGSFLLSKPQHHLDQSNFLCKLCIQKPKKSKPIANIVPLQMLYDMLCCFNLFHMPSITQMLISKINQTIDMTNEVSNAQKRQNKDLLHNFLLYQDCRQDQEADYSTLKTKLEFAIISINYFVERMEKNEVFSDCFSKKTIAKGFTQEKKTYLIRQMRDQISIKLQTLKILNKLLKNFKQPVGFRQICKQACFMLKAPLKSFLKTAETSKNVLYSIDRRQVQLKIQDQCQIDSEDYQNLQELVRLNLPLRNQSVVFRLKCLVPPDAFVKIGFYFMTSQDYTAEVQYKKAIQPLELIFIVNSGSNDESKTEKTAQLWSQTSRCQPQKIKYCNILHKDRKRYRNREEGKAKTLPFIVSMKKERKEKEPEVIQVSNDTKIELKYERMGNCFSVVNLSEKKEIYKRKFYRKAGIEWRHLQVFPCVVLCNPDCSVEYVVQGKQN